MWAHGDFALRSGSWPLTFFSWADINIDIPNLLESVENLYLQLHDLTKRFGESEETAQLGKEDAAALNNSNLRPGMDSGELRKLIREMNPEFYQRLIFYLQELPQKMAKRAEQERVNCPEIDQTAMRIMSQLEETNAKDTRVHYRNHVRKLGSSEAMSLANEAQQRVRLGKTTRSAAGEFLSMCKKRLSEQDVYYQEMLEWKQGVEYEPWDPRSYQMEWSSFVKSSNVLLVAPTGSGKTKIAAMCVNQMWETKPGAKVVFLAQTIPLNIQQMGAMKQACSPILSDGKPPVPPRIMCFGSFNDVEVKSWDQLLEK